MLLQAFQTEGKELKYHSSLIDLAPFFLIGGAIILIVTALLNKMGEQGYDQLHYL